ncbi:2,3-bisphosphoglycerate-independent phosphoglycerate mutase [Candidatus Collierbacteria bacterium]|nr:2,3-bisphosphoglycerate-independent phosphoglycerate mutase [Candidatus Collierbacteria bacterium]
MNRPVVLVILDGWGIGSPGPGNAITLANTPAINKLKAGFPSTQLAAAGESVGLPHGEDGNTETGHLNLGAGQIVYQDLPRINMAIADGTFFNNSAFLNAVEHIQRTKGDLHFLGLVGSGGVHSNIEHLYALMRFAKQNGIGQVYLHLITDGRDSPPTSALTYIAQIKQHIGSVGVGQIVSVMGRYWAMDRDHRWERTAVAYKALTKGEAEKAFSPEEAIKNSYAAGKTDEFIGPTIIVDESNNPITLIKGNDAVIFFNFRIDRPRQLTKAFVLQNFQKEAAKEEFDPFAVKYHQKHLMDKQPEASLFERGNQLQNLYFVTMTRYEENLAVDVAFPPQFIPMPLGRVLSEKGLRQLRLAETEKERFVTYYFNGQRETAFDGEDRQMVESPKVATYDLKPEMSTPELSDMLRKKIRSGIYDFILVNVACPDMVAHTGNLEASIKACEAADKFVDIALQETLGADGVLLVTADHGNAEELINSITNQPDTEHSVSDVPLYIAGRQYQGKPARLQSGILADVAPTILKIMGIEKPQSMNGRSLL